MNLRKPLSLSILFAALLGAVFAAEVEIKEQTVAWEGSMPAKTHNGIIPIQSLHAAVNEAGLLTELKVVLAMENLADQDLKKDKDRLKLEGHLKSEDFFHVSKYPTALFELKTHKEGILSGTLTIRGISKAVEIPATLTKTQEGNWALKADFSFNRQDYNVNYQNGGFFGAAKDKLIRDQVDVHVAIVFAITP